MERTQKKGFFKDLKNSVFNFDSYPNFAVEKMSDAIKYFMKLLLIFSIIIALFFTILQIFITIPKVKNYVLNDLPDFSYSNGNLELKQEDSVTIDNIANNVLVIIDTKELSEEDISKYKDKVQLYDIGILVVKDKIFFKNIYSTSSNLNEISMSELGNIYGKTEFTKTDVVNSINSINMISLGISLFLTVFLGFFITYVIISILDLIILALLCNIVAMLLGLRVKVSALANIAIHSMTLPIILLLIYTMVLMATGFEIKYFSIMYRGISYIYAITALFLIKNTLLKQKIELTAIIQKQQEIDNKLKNEKNEKDEEKKEEKKESKDTEKEKEGTKKKEDNNVGKEANGEA